MLSFSCCLCVVGVNYFSCNISNVNGDVGRFFCGNVLRSELNVFEEVGEVGEVG